METSVEWRVYYEQNAKALLEIPWDQGGDLTPDECHAIARSLEEFQAGESSEGKHLVLNGIPLVRTTFADRVFRRLRVLIGNLEISIGVLITAEIIAKVYYAALHEATGSKVLRTLCEQILRDELRHVQFQAGQLSKIRAHRSRLWLAATMALQRFLYFGTVLVVWLLHRRVIRHGGLSAVGWWTECWVQFDRACAPVGPDGQVASDWRIIRASAKEDAQ